MAKFVTYTYVSSLCVVGVAADVADVALCDVVPFVVVVVVVLVPVVDFLCADVVVS